MTRQNQEGDEKKRVNRGSWQSFLEKEFAERPEHCGLRMIGLGLGHAVQRRRQSEKESRNDIESRSGFALSETNMPTQEIYQRNRAFLAGGGLLTAFFPDDSASGPLKLGHPIFGDAMRLSGSKHG
ncbi:MAG: hypothetical protein EOP02_00315 [Proteobacteria bacterium]|jgi:hypothetical protein|nr:MAG: hypothetical protein EOP02_00315 [Pseudomonadota bacterium]